MAEFVLIVICAIVFGFAMGMWFDGSRLESKVKQRSREELRSAKVALKKETRRLSNKMRRIANKGGVKIGDEIDKVLNELEELVDPDTDDEDSKGKD